MPAGKKVWVIDADPPARKSQRRSAPEQKGGGVEHSVVPGAAALRDHGRPRREGAGGHAGLTASQVVAAYTLGSASPFIVQQHAHGGFWAAVHITCFAIWSLVLSQWQLVESAFSHGWLPFHVWLVGMFVVGVAGVTSWSRAIYLVGRQFSEDVPQSSRRVRGSLEVGLLGLVVPGLGLMLVGRAWRAAVASWVSGLVALSIVVLWQASSIWEAYQQSTQAGLGSLALEKLFAACTLAMVLGLLAWIVNAYDGARLANRIPLRASMQGPWWAVALLLSAAAFLITFDPAQRAQDLDDVAASMREAGLQYLPLQVQLASLRLDPSNLAYQIQVVEMYEDLGRDVEAAALREDVLSRWEAYSEWMQQGRQAASTPGEELPHDEFSSHRPVRFLLPIQP